MEFDWKGLTPPANGQSTARWRGVRAARRGPYIFDLGRGADHRSVQQVIAAAEHHTAGRADRRTAQIREESYDGFPSETCNGGIDAVSWARSRRVHISREYAHRRRHARRARSRSEG